MLLLVFGIILGIYVLWAKSSEWNGKNRVQLIHIPKTAGSSFEKDVVHIDNLLGEAYTSTHGESPFKKKFKDHKNEICYNEGYNDKNFNVMLFRNPRDHVYSQYLEVKYDPGFGVHKTKGTMFPRDYTDEVGFDLWLNYFELSAWGKLYVGDFNTYNPINMQTRYLVCTEEAHHWYIDMGEDSVESNMPSLKEALRNLETIDLVGVTEFYPTFMCIFVYRTLNFLPPQCDCSYVAETNSTIQTHTILHGVPRHSWLLLPTPIINKVDKLTELDKQVYEEALKAFVGHVEKVEKEVSKTILCRESVQNAVNQTLKYLDVEVLSTRLKNTA